MLEMNASSKMLPAFIFYPIVMEIHCQSPRQLRFQGEFGPIVTLLGYHICPNPPFLVLGRGGESCLKIIKSSLIKHGVWENVWKVMRVRAIWLCFYGNRTNLSSVCHLFYRIGRRSKLRPVPSSASSVCHLEPGCRKTLVLCVLEMMSMCVIIINRIKLYCQTRVTWLSCVKVPFACLQLYTEARRIYLQTEGLDSPLSHKFRLAQEKKMQDMLISMIPVSHKARLYI